MSGSDRTLRAVETAPPANRVQAIKRLGVDRTLKAEALRAKGWTIASIAKQVQADEATIRKLLEGK